MTDGQKAARSTNWIKIFILIAAAIVLLAMGFTHSTTIGWVVLISLLVFLALYATSLFIVHWHETHRR
jgi:hypothetical protein